MSTKTAEIRVSGLTVQIVRKDIKNLHLSVYPPNGRVRVAAPLRVSDKAVLAAVTSKLGWIKKQQAKFAAQPRQAEREMVSGESHYVQGRRYRLDVLERPGRTSICLRNNSTLELRVRPGTSRQNREAALHRWYRQLLRGQISELIAKWEPVMGVNVANWGMRKMKTRWGTCNVAARRVSLSLDLAKQPLSCLEYILVHEMVHLLERHHNDRFEEHLDGFMPQWRLRREELNRTPLSHESRGRGSHDGQNALA